MTGVWPEVVAMRALERSSASSSEAPSGCRHTAGVETHNAQWEAHMIGFLNRSLTVSQTEGATR